MFTCCSALVTAINYAQIPWTFKSLGISWCPSFISLALLNSQRICLPQVVFFSSDLELHHYYCNTTTIREPQGKQSSSSCGAQRIRHDTGYLCNTLNILCDWGWGGQLRFPSHTAWLPAASTSCNHTSPSLGMPARGTILLWECLDPPLGMPARKRMPNPYVSPPSRGWQDKRNLSATPLA